MKNYFIFKTLGLFIFTIVCIIGFFLNKNFKVEVASLFLAIIGAILLINEVSRMLDKIKE